MSHELGVTQQVLEIAVDKANEVGAKSIRTINLVIGDMSGFLTESVQFYFDFMANGTTAAGAHLNFRRVPIEACCRSCGHTYLPAGENWDCPNCGARDMEITKGKEFFVESIEVD
jgi:hydrogenase nickel incorporation protein HypA/HybF